MDEGRIFDIGKRYIPGGVSPFIIKSAKGVALLDEDGKEYIDFNLGKGSLVFGHSDDTIESSIINTLKDKKSLFDNSFMEVEISRFICEKLEYIDMVKFFSSKEEAMMKAINLSKIFTKKQKVLTFGFYNECERSEDVIKCEINNEEKLIDIFKVHGQEIASAIFNLASMNLGKEKCSIRFVKLLRNLCSKSGVILIFDEYKTSFRTSFKGFKDYYNLSPDLSVFGQVLGSGLGLAAFGGKRKIMDRYNEKEDVKINTLALTAGFTVLNKLYEHPEYEMHIESVSKKLYDGLNKIKEKYDCKFNVSKFAGMVKISFQDDLYEKYYKYMIREGFVVPLSEEEPLYICTEHTIIHIFKFIKTFESFVEIYGK